MANFSTIAQFFEITNNTPAHLFTNASSPPCPTNFSENDRETWQFYVDLSFGMACVLFAFCIAGVVTNTVSIVIYSHPAMRSSINVLLIGLSIFDLCLSILSIPVFCAGSFQMYTQDTEFFAPVIAYSTLYLYPLVSTAQTCSIFCFVVITCERYIAVCRPFQARWSSTGRSKRALVGVTTAALLYNVVRFFEMSPLTSEQQLQRPGEDNLSDALCLENYTGEYELDSWLKENPLYLTIYYSGMYLVTHFLVPFSVLAVVNGRMIYSIQLAKQQRRLLSQSERKEHRTAVMMGMVVLMFACCNTLPFVLNFVELVDPLAFKLMPNKVLMFALLDVSNLLVVANAATTIVIYYACSQKYRQLLHYYLLNYWCAYACDLIRCCCRKNDTVEKNAFGVRYGLRKCSAFSFISAVAFYGPAQSQDTTNQTWAGCSRRCSTVVECNQGGEPRTRPLNASSPLLGRLQHGRASPGRHGPCSRSQSQSPVCTPPMAVSRSNVIQHVPAHLGAPKSVGRRSIRGQYRPHQNQLTYRRGSLIN